MSPRGARLAGRLHIGLGVSRDSVRAVGVRGGRIVWALEGDLDAGEPLSQAVAALLQSALLPAWPRPVVFAALGPSSVQVKRLAGLPPLRDADEIACLVREGIGRFFLKNGVPLLAGGVHVTSPGTAWAAAFEEPAVREIEAGCRAARVSLRLVVPAVTVLGAALEDGSLTWTDGEAAAEVALADGRLRDVRRLAGPAARELEPTAPREAVRALGEGAVRFADAVGAATLGPGEPTALDPAGNATRLAGVPRWRAALAAVTLAVSATAALLAPGLIAVHQGRESAARLRELAAPTRGAGELLARHRHLSAALAEVVAFDAHRVPVSLFLSDLTRALPPGSAIVSVRLDSTGGNLIAVGARAASIPPQLEGVPGLRSPEIVGPVTRELIGTQELERATIRFRIDPARVARR